MHLSCERISIMDFLIGCCIRKKLNIAALRTGTRVAIAAAAGSAAFWLRAQADCIFVVDSLLYIRCR
jgi:hypothetical protein